jgi:peptidyl-prolyl cis-trans isomerase D
MLQSIRDRTQGWIAGVIISLVILSFALWGIHSYIVGMAENQPVAKVNGAEITKKDFSTAYERLRRQAQAKLGTPTLSDKIDAEIKQLTLTTLINTQVLAQASTAEDYEVTPTQIYTYLKNMPEFQVGGTFSGARFQQLLATSLFTQDEFLDYVKKTLLVDQPKLGILMSSFALPNEIDNTIALVNQQRDMDYINLLQSDFLKQNTITVSDAEVSDFYKQHPELFKTPEQVSIEYVELSMKDLMASIHPTDEVLTKFYNDNVHSYTLPKQWKLAKILLPLSATATEQEVADTEKKATQMLMDVTKGTDFMTLVHQYPEDKKTVDKPLDWVTLNQMPAEIQKSVAALTNVGEVSEPIRTKDGLLIVKVVDFKDAAAQPFAQVKNQIQEMVTRQLAEEKFAELRDKLSNIAYESPDSLQPVATGTNLPIQSTPLFSRDKDAGDPVSKDKKVRDVAFTDDVLNSKNNSDVVQLNPDTVIVLRDKEHLLSTALPLSAVQGQISDHLKSMKADKQIADLAADIQKKLQAGTLTPDQVTQQYHFNWTALGFIGRDSTKVDAALVNSVFQLPRPQNGKVGYASVKTPTGYAVVAVKTVRDGTLAANDKDQYKKFTDQVQNGDAVLEYNLYATSLIQKAKITSYLNAAPDSASE